MQIGFIGLGHMGNPMAKNLLAAGFDVTVFDVVTEAMQKLVEQGAQPAASLQELAQSVDVIFTMLQTGEQVTKVCNSEDGLFQSAKQGTLFIDCSSIDVETSRYLHHIAEEKGFLMVDAPVSGGVIGAEAATLTIMVGGSQTAFEKAQPVLVHLGKNIVHAGAAGNGQVAKICNNMILGITMIGVSEAFNLGEKLGLDNQTFFEISSKASGQCWAMTSYCPAPGILENAPSSHNYQPGFTAAMMLKDLRLSQQAASSANAQTPLGKAATALYERFVEDEKGNLDFSAIFKQLHGDSLKR